MNDWRIIIGPSTTIYPSLSTWCCHTARLTEETLDAVSGRSGRPSDVPVHLRPRVVPLCHLPSAPNRPHSSTLIARLLHLTILSFVSEPLSPVSTLTYVSRQLYSLLRLGLQPRHATEIAGAPSKHTAPVDVFGTSQHLVSRSLCSTGCPHLSHGTSTCVPAKALLASELAADGQPAPIGGSLFHFMNDQPPGRV